MVYLDALWPVDGESVGDIVGVEAAQTVTAAQSDPTSGSVIAGADQLARLLGVTDADDVAWLASKLTPQPAASAIQPLKLQHAGRGSTRCSCPAAATTFEGTELSYARAREYAATDARVRTVEIDAPHNVMVDAPGPAHRGPRSRHSVTSPPDRGAEPGKVAFFVSLRHHAAFPHRRENRAQSPGARRLDVAR